MLTEPPCGARKASWSLWSLALPVCGVPGPPAWPAPGAGKASWSLWLLARKLDRISRLRPAVMNGVNTTNNHTARAASRKRSSSVTGRSSGA